jgi:hypothetical protein
MVDEEDKESLEKIPQLELTNKFVISISTIELFSFSSQHFSSIFFC